MANRTGYEATVHLLTGRKIRVLVESTRTKEGLINFMGEPDEDEDDYEYENWNAFLRIPVNTIEYIEETELRTLSRNENYGVIEMTEKKTKIKLQVGKNRLAEVE